MERCREGWGGMGRNGERGYSPLRLLIIEFETVTLLEKRPTKEIPTTE